MDATTYKHSSENMCEIGDNTIHLIITSPPYPMIEKWDNLFGVVDFEQQHCILDKVWSECHRVLIEGGICCINIGDATRSITGNFQCFPNKARVTMKCVEIGFTPLIPIIWKKIGNKPNSFLGSGFLPPNAYISLECEYIVILRKGRVRKFNPKDEVRINSRYTKEERDLWFQQLWCVPGVHGARKSSKFPDEIAYRLIRMFSIESDIVVDPFSGTGTTGKYANFLNRKFIGYEIGKPKEKGMFF